MAFLELEPGGFVSEAASEPICTLFGLSFAPGGDYRARWIRYIPQILRNAGSITLRLVFISFVSGISEINLLIQSLSEIDKTLFEHSENLIIDLTELWPSISIYGRILDIDISNYISPNSTLFICEIRRNSYLNDTLAGDLIFEHGRTLQ